MCEELSYQIINTSAVNQAVFCYYENIAKIIIEKKTVLTLASKAGNTFLNSLKRDLAKRIYITLGVYEFLNWYKALYSAPSSTFRHLDFIRAVRWLRATSPMVYF